LPVVDDAPPVSQMPFHVCQDVGGHEDGALPAQTGDHFQHFFATRRIERAAGGSLQEEHLGLD